MKSGTISRRELRDQRPARPPMDYLPLLGVLALALMILIWFAGRFSVDSETAVAVVTPSATPSTTPIRPTPTTTPTLRPLPRPTSTPTIQLPPTVTLSPSPPPTPVPTDTPTPAPTATLAPAGLVIVSPPDGIVVNVGGIVVSGLAPPGSTITWDRPLWFDDHTTADVNGQWSFVIGLNVGDNVLTFRVADDLSTARTITVRYQP